MPDIRLLVEKYEQVLNEAKGRPIKYNLSPEQAREIIDWYNDKSADRASVKDISNMYNIPYKSLGSLLSRWRQAGLLHKRYGPPGVILSKKPPLVKSKPLTKRKSKDRGFIKWAPEQVKDILTRYTNGESVLSIAKVHGVSAGSVSRVINMSDVPLRVSSDVTGPRHFFQEPVRDEEELNADEKKYGYEYKTRALSNSNNTIFMQSPAGEVEEINPLDKEIIYELELQGWTKLNSNSYTPDLSDIPADNY